MPTSNMTATLAWAKIADSSNTELLVTWETPVTIEFATVATDVAPTTINGHRLQRDSAVSRGGLGAGFVFARLAEGSIPTSCALVVTK